MLIPNHKPQINSWASKTMLEATEGVGVHRSGTEKASKGLVSSHLCAIKFRWPHPLRGPTKQHRLCVPLNVFQSRSRGYDHPSVRLVRK